MHESRGRLRGFDWRRAVDDGFADGSACRYGCPRTPFLCKDRRQSKASLRFDPDGPLSPLPTRLLLLNASTYRGLNTWKDENWVFHKLVAKDASIT